MGHIYGIIDIAGEKHKPLYVGQTKESLSTRWSKHKSACRLHPNQNLHRYIVKNGGTERYLMFLIEDVDDAEQLSIREKWHISHLKPPLNVQHNLSNKQKIHVTNENVENTMSGPFSCMVSVYKWLINDIQKASNLLKND